MQNTIWYSTVLAFAAGALAYVFLNPSLAENKFFILGVILIVYWSATFVNFQGLKIASWLTTVLVLCGTIFPLCILIVLGILWIVLGNPIEFLKVKDSLIPDFTNFDDIAFL